MVILLTYLDVRINRWDVSGRRSQPCVSLSALRLAAMTGRRASEFCKRVATPPRTLVRPIRRIRKIGRASDSTDCHP